MKRYRIKLGNRILHTSTTRKRALYWFKAYAPAGAVLYPVWIAGNDLF